MSSSCIPRVALPPPIGLHEDATFRGKIPWQRSGTSIDFDLGSVNEVIAWRESQWPRHSEIAYLYFDSNFVFQQSPLGE
jgi:hypothetical protein